MTTYLRNPATGVKPPTPKAAPGRRTPKRCQATALQCLAFILLFTISPALAQENEPEADPNELPRVAATEPADAIATFEIRPGFELELAAHEPLVMDPIDIEFDEKGRLFVVEMRGYSEHREDALGRIKLLVDDNDDGTFDRATIYAEGLKWPTSVCCYDGGIFVAATPDIFYFKDTDGDGVSDTKETVFTGFGSTESRLNMQALVNSLTWGPDNRIWGATARNGGRVRRPDQPEDSAVDLRGADFSFDPKTRDIRAENGTAQFGMSFDSRGRRFVCSNSNHIQWVAWERHLIEPNEYYTLPSPFVSIAADGPAAPVFRISPDEPWRIVRTRWRVGGVVKGPVEGGGRVSGYFTAATGITIYTGDALGPAFRNNAFIGDAGSNLVHRKVIRNAPRTFEPVAERAADETDIEFLRSRDNWFRPVNFANGPDGCLYICDMYREVIEHPWSLPEGIKKHLDLNSGNDRGRIWRVVPKGFKHPAFSLERDSGWQHVTNQRLASSGMGFQPMIHRQDADPTILESAPFGTDPWVAAFTLNKLATPAAMLDVWNQRDLPLAFRAQLAEMMGKTKDKKALRAVVDSLATAGVSPDSERIFTALGNGLRTAKLSLAKADPEHRLASLFAAARAVAADTNASEKDRASALHLLALDSETRSAETIRALVARKDAPEAVRNAAIAALGSRSGAAGLLIENWPTFSASLKSVALTALTARPENARALLEAVQSGAIPKDDIPLNTATLLRAHRDAKVKALAGKIVPAPVTVSRQSIVDRYRPALKLKGNAARGETVYKKAACFTCHQSPGGEGFAVGPDLASFKTAGGDSIIKNLFDPNAEVAPQFHAYAFSLESGEAVIGIIAREDQRDVTVRMAGGIERTFPRRDVAAMKGLGQSLMPEGLEGVLTEQDVADLLSFIITAH